MFAGQFCVWAERFPAHKNVPDARRTNMILNACIVLAVLQLSSWNFKQGIKVKNKMGRSNSSFYTQENRQLLPMSREYLYFKAKKIACSSLSDVKNRWFKVVREGEGGSHIGVISPIAGTQKAVNNSSMLPTLNS
jgi:hypothetical protein